MGDGTKISWTDATWSVTVGCSRVSEGCDRCYAMGQAPRQSNRGLYEGVVEGGDWTGRLNLAGAEVLDRPLRWTRPRRVFVDSMSDLFHEGVPMAFIAAVWARMGLAERHRFQVLTKRPQRMMRLVGSERFREMWDDERFTRALAGDVQRQAIRGAVSLAKVWPLPNIEVGTSIELDKYAFRANYVRATPAAFRFVSAEPLLGPLPSLDLAGIDWLIVGGESGNGARRMDPAWARDLIERCDTAGTRVHFKQAGRVLGAEWGCADGHGGDETAYPDWAKRREVPA